MPNSIRLDIPHKKSWTSHNVKPQSTASPIGSVIGVLQRLRHKFAYSSSSRDRSPDSPGSDKMMFELSIKLWKVTDMSKGAEMSDANISGAAVSNKSLDFTQSTILAMVNMVNYLQPEVVLVDLTAGQLLQMCKAQLLQTLAVEAMTSVLRHCAAQINANFARNPAMRQSRQNSTYRSRETVQTSGPALPPSRGRHRHIR